MSPNRTPPPADSDVFKVIKGLDAIGKASYRDGAQLRREVQALRHTVESQHHLQLEKFSHSLQRNALTSRMEKVALDIDDLKYKIDVLNDDGAKTNAAHDTAYERGKGKSRARHAAELRKLRKERRRILAELQKLDAKGIKLALGYQKTLVSMESIRTSKHLI